MTRHQSAPQRQPITAVLVAVLKSANFPVGNTNQPEDPYGWQGEPNAVDATFIPWMEIIPGPANPQPSQGFGDTGKNWILRYNVFYAGVDGNQTEKLADKMRIEMTNVDRDSIQTNDGVWKIQNSDCTAVGSVVRTGATIPFYYSQTDSFEIWVTKEG